MADQNSNAANELLALGQEVLAALDEGRAEQERATGADLVAATHANFRNRPTPEEPPRGQFISIFYFIP